MSKSTPARLCSAIASAVVIVCTGLMPGCGKAPNRNESQPSLVPIAVYPDGESSLQRTADFIALGPRNSGTDGAERAARHIYDTLLAFGLEPHIQQFTDETPIGPVVFRNVLCTLHGATDREIILISHYDTMSGIADDFIGANDSGSSTGLLLEIARILAPLTSLPCRITLAFVDGEECMVAYGPIDGLHGSRYLASAIAADAQRKRNIAAVIVVDMIGDKDLTVTLARNASPHLNALVLDVASDLGVRSHFKLFGRAILDDHVPFLDRGMPATVLIDFEYGTQPGLNDLWHTPRDTIEQLSAESLKIIGRVVIEMINRIANAQAQT